MVYELFGETDLYYPIFYNGRFELIFLVIGSIIGGYVGYRLNQHQIKQVEIGRSLNKKAGNAAKLAFSSLFVLLFTGLYSLGGNIDNVSSILTGLLIITLSISALLLAWSSISETRKTKESGDLYVATSFCIIFNNHIFWFEYSTVSLLLALNTS